MINLIEKWLIDRRRRVVVDGEVSNCKSVLSGVGHWNEDAQYTMGDTVLNTTVKEKDLGLTISADMKVSEQCGIAAAKGNQILGLIRRYIVYKEKELIILLYKIIQKLRNISYEMRLKECGLTTLETRRLRGVL